MIEAHVLWVYGERADGRLPQGKVACVEAVVDDIFAIRMRSDVEALVECQGELDICAVPELQAVLERAIQRSCGQVQVDMAQVRYIDSACIKELLAARDRLAGCGGRLTMVEASPAVRRALRLLSLESRFGLSP